MKSTTGEGDDHPRPLKFLGVSVASDGKTSSVTAWSFIEGRAVHCVDLGHF